MSRTISHNVMRRKRDAYPGTRDTPVDMTHPVRHAARPRVPLGRTGADTMGCSERGTSMQTPHVNQSAWNGNSRGFPWDHLKLAHSILDPEALEIFRSTSTEEMTAVELSRRCGISTGRTYRLLRRLESLGLVVSREGGPQKHGVPSRVCRSALQSISVSLGEDQIRTRIEVSAGSIPLVSEYRTMIESSDTPPVARRRSRRQRIGPERIHLIDPPAATPNSRRRLPINLPAFLEEPLSRLMERR